MADVHRVQTASPAPTADGGAWTQQQQQQRVDGDWTQQPGDPSQAVLQAVGAWLAWAWQQYGRFSLTLVAQAILVLVLLYVLAHIVARLRGRK